MSEFELPGNEYPTIYRHSMRPAWGLAVLVSDMEDKRGYQFEDGDVRHFKRGFYHLMEEVELPVDQLEQAMARLEQVLGRRRAASQAGVGIQNLLSLDQQAAILRVLHPKGFGDPTWLRDMRGQGAKSRLKRHRDPAMATAQDLLSAERLEAYLDKEQYGEAVAALLKVFTMTDLVPPAQRALLNELDEERHPEVAISLHGMLYGEDELSPRFSRLVTALDTRSWELATAAAALVHPQEHVCVRHAAFKRQALWMAPRMQHGKLPTAALYTRYLEMAQVLRERLTGLELPPQDLLDVHDFMKITLKPSARKLLKDGKSTDDGKAAA